MIALEMQGGPINWYILHYPKGVHMHTFWLRAISTEDAMVRGISLGIISTKITKMP